GPLPALARGPRGVAGAAVPPVRRAGVARALWSGAGAEEPGHPGYLGPLPRPAGAGPAGGRQLLLPRLPLPLAAPAGPAAVSSRLELAATGAQQVAGGRLVRADFVRLRVVWAVGGAAVDGLAHSWLLRRRAGGRCPVQACVVLQVALPDRAVQLRRLGDVAAGNSGPRRRGLYPVPHQGLHSRHPHPAPSKSLDERPPALPADHLTARVRAGALSADEGRQYGLYVLPRLCPRLPARQCRPGRPVARVGA